MTDRQNKVQERAEPIIARAYSQMLDHGVAPADAAQAMILTACGILARVIGPNGAGHSIREVADAQHVWLSEIASSVEGMALPH